MTSKTLSAKLLRESIKRGTAFGALLTLVFFCYFPVGGMLLLRTFKGDVITDVRYQLLLYGGNNPVLFVITFATAALLGIFMFSFLHSQDKVDFYHSLPVRREKLFGIQYLAGVLLWFVPYAVNSLLYMILCALKGRPADPLMALQSLAAHLICFLLVYSMMILAMMLTGKIFVAIAGMIVLCGYIPAVTLLTAAMMDLHFATCPDTLYAVGTTGYKLSPVMVYVLTCGQMMGNDTYRFPKALMLAALLTAFLTAVISLCLYRRRRSEAAGSAISFYTAGRVIKFLIVVPCALACYLFLYAISGGSILWGLLGLLLGLLIFSGVVEFIYTMDIREIFRDRGQLLLTAVVVVAVMCEFWFDLTGYDKWVPDKNGVSYVEISAAGMMADSYIGYYEEAGGEDNYYAMYFREKNAVRVDGENIELVRDMVKNTGEVAGFEETADEGEEVYEAGMNTQFYQKEKDIYRLPLDITWHFENGKVRSRSYSLSNRMWREYFGKLWELDEVQETCYPLLKTGEEDILKIVVNSLNKNTYEEHAYDVTEEKEYSGDIEKLMETLKEEIRGRKMDQAFKPYDDTVTVIYRGEDGNVYGEEIGLTEDFPKTKKLLERVADNT